MVRLTADYSFHFRFVFDEQKGIYSDPSQASSKDVTLGSFRFVFDWLKNQIYYCKNNFIMLYDISSGNFTPIYNFSKTEHCRFIKIDPFNR